MEERSLTRDDLAILLGVGVGRAFEVLGRRRRLTIAMVRELAPALGLSERCLVQDYQLDREEAPAREHSPA